MRIALVQMFCGWGRVEENLRRSREHIRAARGRGADLVVFPELSAHGMWKDHMVRLAAEPIDGPIVRRMAGWARRHKIAIAFGLAERTPGKPYVSYVLLDARGKLVGVHRKNRVTKLERLFFRPDSRRPIFRLGALKVAVAICADCCDAAMLKGYARRGAELVLMPHAWDADPILRNGKVASWSTPEEMVDANVRGRIARYRTHDEMLREFTARLAPAAANGFYAVFVNQVGRPHPLIPCVGPSFVASPSGKIVARSRSGREQMLIADLTLSR